MNILSTAPIQNEGFVSLLESITVTFDEPINADSVDEASITVASERNPVEVIGFLPQPVGVFDTDLFVGEESLGPVSGQVTVAGSTITFTPRKKYEANTTYIVYISDTILSTVPSGLSKIYTFKFTTREEDMIESLPEIVGTTKIIGTNLSFNGSIGSEYSSEPFYVASTNPISDSFLISNTDVEIEFNIEVKDALTEISVYRYELLSDYPPDKLIAATDYIVQLAGVNKTVKISLLDSAIKANSVYEIVLPAGFESETGEKLSQKYVFSYVGKLTPYHSSTKLMRLKAGTVLTNVANLNLAVSIYYSSLMADNLFINSGLTGRSLNVLKTKYVLYDALEITLMNNYSFGLNDFIKKQLAEFSISISNKTKVEIYNQLLREIRSWKLNVKSLLTYIRPGSGVFQKNKYKPSDIGRLWNSGTQPGINSKIETGALDLNTWDDMIVPLPNPLTT